MRSEPVIVRRAPAVGRIRLGLLLGLAIVAAGIYAGSQAAFHYWVYWNLQQEAERAALDVAAKGGQEALARQTVQAKAREYGLELKDEDIQVSIQDGAVTISFAWERPIQLPGYTYPFAFQVNVTTTRRVR